jgi:transposase InsO family protein
MSRWRGTQKFNTLNIRQQTASGCCGGARPKGLGFPPGSGWGAACPAPRTAATVCRSPLNLLARNFSAERPGRVWLADISYIPTGEGFLYLAAIKDMATREIIGWSMADHLRAELYVDALVMAIQRHRPPRGLVHHGDRGVQTRFNWSSQRLSAPSAAPHQGLRRASFSRASCAACR